MSDFCKWLNIALRIVSVPFWNYQRLWLIVNWEGGFRAVNKSDESMAIFNRNHRSCQISTKICADFRLCGDRALVVAIFEGGTICKFIIVIGQDWATFSRSRGPLTLWRVFYGPLTFCAVSFRYCQMAARVSNLSQLKKPLGPQIPHLACHTKFTAKR